jgi:hypothetical protein
MVGILGWLRKKVFFYNEKEDVDYETILEQIDADIRQAEVKAFDTVRNL